MFKRIRKGKLLTVKPMRILSRTTSTNGDLRVVVSSRTSDAKHTVTRRDGKWGCSCRGFKPRRPKGKPKAPKRSVECYHILKLQGRAA